MDSWKEAEDAYRAGAELLATDTAKAHAKFAQAQAATWFWMAETMEATRLTLLQFIGQLPPDTGEGQPPAGGN